MTFPTDTAPDSIKLGAIETDITYGSADGISLTMDIYYPKIEKKPASAVVRHLWVELVAMAIRVIWSGQLGTVFKRAKAE